MTSPTSLPLAASKLLLVQPLSNLRTQPQLNFQNCFLVFLKLSHKIQPDVLKLNKQTNGQINYQTIELH